MIGGKIIDGGVAQIEHGQASVTVPAMRDTDAVLWSVDRSQADCRIYMVSRQAGRIEWRCGMHRDCHGSLSWTVVRGAP